MKRGVFKIKCYNNETEDFYLEERNGLISTFFGIHRVPKNAGYKVTHLPTGCGVRIMRTQKQARKLVAELEKGEEIGHFPISWGNADPESFYPNGPETRRIINRIREE